MDIELQLTWRTTVGGKAIEIDDLLFDLLRDVQAGGHLNFAAKKSAVSYRHAWGLIRTWENRFNTKLLLSQRGRGAVLTDFAEQLIHSHADTAELLQSDLAEQALRASASIAAARESKIRRIRIASSHDDRVVRLREQLESEACEVAVEMLGSEGALRNYRRGEADIAGFHMPIGELGPMVATRLLQFLDDTRDEIFLLEKRQLGLLSRADDPCSALGTLIDRQLRFVNRQAGSATRLTFDALISSEGHDPSAINGYGEEEYTHTAVAALVVSKDADVAFAQERKASHFNLAFEPMVEERFYLVVSRDVARSIRQTVCQFCEKATIGRRESMRAEEFKPTVMVLKQIHE